MKAKVIHREKLPDWGARSKSYFGINLLFSSDFFHKTSSRGKIGSTNNPIPKPLRIYEAQQVDLRELLFFKMDDLGYTRSQALTEWEGIICDATNAATDYFSMEYSGQVNPFVPYCKAAISACSVAGEVGISEVKKIVSLKSGKEGLKFFSFLPTSEFKFGVERVKRDVPERVKYVLIRNQPWCSCCGQRPPNVVLHVDHIVALKNGGGNNVENLQVLCSSCNLGKGAMK